MRVRDVVWATAWAVVWVAVTAALQWSVVRFRVLIVLALTGAAALLLVSLLTRRPVHPGGRVGALLLVASALVLWQVPLFTHLRGQARTASLVVVTATALGCAALLWSARPQRRWPVAVAAGLAVSGHLVLAAVTIVGSPAPRIDVWVMLQQSSDLLARGENFYTAVWSGSPGVQDLYTYLPFATVLLAPGRWLAGDVRWALLAWSLVLFATLLALARRGAGPLPGAALVALVVTMPGTITQIDQAWTEPLLAALLALWALLVSRGAPWWAVVPLALACATKQHLVLLIPLLMVWRDFGWRRVLATGALTGVLISPWVLADPGAFVHDTVTALVGFHPIRFANTWYLLALNEFGVHLPFWVTGLVVLAAVGGALWCVGRRQPELGELLRWMALVLLIANLVNKQAFYNQFWLSIALVALSLAVSPAAPGPPRRRTARGIRPSSRAAGRALSRWPGRTARAAALAPPPPPRE